MLPRSRSTLLLCSLIITFCMLLPGAAKSQDSSSSQQSQDNNTTEGTVVASSRVTFVVRSDDNRFHLFTFDHDTTRPAKLPVGAHVRVTFDQGDQEGAEHATNVAVLDQAQSGSSSASASTSPRDAAPIPPTVRNVEHDIQHEARRWRMGVRGGVGLDPELVLFGVHSQMGPVFNRNFFFRPNADFEWGEITDMVALNFEGVYRIPTRGRRGWEPYVGGGPSMNFIHQSFQTHAGQGRNISFGNFDYETGLNILVGFQNRRGTFFEFKTSVYSQPAPVLRVLVGRNF